MMVELSTFLSFTEFNDNSSYCSTNGNLYFQMFEDLLIALENLEEQDHKKRGKLAIVAAESKQGFGN